MPHGCVSLCVSVCVGYVGYALPAHMFLLYLCVQFKPEVVTQAATQVETARLRGAICSARSPPDKTSLHPKQPELDQPRGGGRSQNALEHLGRHFKAPRCDPSGEGAHGRLAQALAVPKAQEAQKSHFGYVLTHDQARFFFTPSRGGVREFVEDPPSAPGVQLVG